jgi:hypothetical protein
VDSPQLIDTKTRGELGGPKEVFSPQFVTQFAIGHSIDAEILSERFHGDLESSAGGLRASQLFSFNGLPMETLNGSPAKRAHSQ